MTSNQIELYKAKEQGRHNIRTEGQTDVSLAESIRHNKATESINWFIAGSNREIGLITAETGQRNVAVQEQKLPYEISQYEARTEEARQHARLYQQQKFASEQVTPFVITDYRSQATRRDVQNVEDSQTGAKNVQRTVSSVTQLLPFFVTPYLVQKNLLK